MSNNSQSSQDHKINLDVLCIQEEDGSCTAVGIQYYVVAQGDDFNEAVDNLFKLLLAQHVYDVSEGRQSLLDFSEAPSDYRKRFEKSQLSFSRGFRNSTPVVTANCKFEPCSQLSLAT